MKTFMNKKLLYSGIVCLVLGGTNLFAKDVKTMDVLVHAETVKAISQDLAKNYFYIQQEIQASSAKKSLKKDMIALDDAIRKLQMVANSKDKGVVEFMFFSTDELKSIMKEKFTSENGGLVLDYTETLLEGSESIIKHNHGKSESMLSVVEEMVFLLERATKYYIAFRAGYTDVANITQAKLAVEQFETLLKKVQAYTYPGALASGPVKKLSKYWPVSKNFYLGIKKSELPTIVFISTKHMKRALDKLIEYHKQNN